MVHVEKQGSGFFPLPSIIFNLDNAETTGSLSIHLINKDKNKNNVVLKIISKDKEEIIFKNSILGKKGISILNIKVKPKDNLELYSDKEISFTVHALLKEKK